MLGSELGENPKLNWKLVVGFDFKSQPSIANKAWKALRNLWFAFSYLLSSSCAATPIFIDIRKFYMVEQDLNLVHT